MLVEVLSSGFLSYFLTDNCSSKAFDNPFTQLKISENLYLHSLWLHICIPVQAGQSDQFDCFGERIPILLRHSIKYRTDSSENCFLADRRFIQSFFQRFDFNNRSVTWHR